MVGWCVESKTESQFVDRLNDNTHLEVESRAIYAGYVFKSGLRITDCGYIIFIGEKCVVEVLAVIGVRAIVGIGYTETHTPIHCVIQVASKIYRIFIDVPLLYGLKGAITRCASAKQAVEAVLIVG